MRYYGGGLSEFGLGSLGGNGYNTGYDGHRKRRDDGEGYGEQYPTPLTSGSGGGLSGMMQAASKHEKEVIDLIMKTKLNEMIGSPLVYAGLGVGCLLLVIICSFAEYFVIKRSTDADVKYSNVALT